MRSLSREAAAEPRGPFVRIESDDRRRDDKMKLDVAGFIEARTGMPSAMAEAEVDRLTAFDLVTIEIRMREARREMHEFDYDPFASGR